MDKLIVKNLQKSFYSKKEKKYNVVLADLSFSVHPGEFFVLMGESGAGKTTLLRTIAGLEDFDFGDIYLNGRDALSSSSKEKDMSFVTQKYALFPHKTVYENIAMPLLINGYPEEEIISSIQEIAKLVHIESLLTRKPRELSGGQMQRVAIARCLVRKPSLILMDEPFSALDPIFHNELMDLLLEIHRKSKSTFLYSTHNQSEAFYLADRVGLLHNRNMEMFCTEEDFLNRPKTKFVADFFSCFSCFQKVFIEKDGLHFPFDDFVLPWVRDYQKIESHMGEEATIALKNTDFRIDPEGKILAHVSSFRGDSLVLNWRENKINIKTDLDLENGAELKLSICPKNIILFQKGVNILL